MRLHSTGTLVGALVVFAAFGVGPATEIAASRVTMQNDSKSEPVALISVSNRFLVGGANADGEWLGTDATASRLGSPAKLTALGLAP